MQQYRIYLCGSRDDHCLTKLFLKLLPAVGVLRYGKGQKGAGNREFLLEEGEEWPAAGGSGGLLLFKKSFSPPGPIWPLPGWLAVVSSTFGAGLRALRGSGIPAITCGSSLRDTLSISSWDSPQCSISLLRGIVTLDGGVIEPGEVPVYRREKLSREEVLLSCGVLLACGISIEERLDIPAKI